MKNEPRFLIPLILFVLSFLIHPITSYTYNNDTASQHDSERHIDFIKINSPITPVVAKFISESIKEAEEEGAVCLVMELDTPGGLVESTRIIVKDMLGSQIPIVVYVAPAGSRAASAGVWITMAANIAAMAPGSNIGAAHPVTGGGQEIPETMNEKITNDAVANIKSVANQRGRNAEWAEKAVRESISVTAEEALEENVIDLLADNLDDLLDKIDGKKVVLAFEYSDISPQPGVEVERENSRQESRLTRKTNLVAGTAVVLNTKGARIVQKEMSWRYKVLNKISDPNIAYILLMLGIYGLIFELSNPGSILPGVVGGIFVILAFFALQTLPINWAGLLLILFAILLFVAEIKVPSYGLLTVGGVVSLFLGSMMLIDSPVPYLQISWKVILAFVITTAAFFLFAVTLGLKAQRRKPATGFENLIGDTGIAETALDPEGKIYLQGEYWTADSSEKIKRGEKVEVISNEGLKLKVKKMLS